MRYATLILGLAILVASTAAFAQQFCQTRCSTIGGQTTCTTWCV